MSAPLPFREAALKILRESGQPLSASMPMPILGSWA